MDYNNELNFGTSMTRDRELSMSQAFPVLLRKVYVWMSLALAITGITAFEWLTALVSFRLSIATS